MLAQVVIQMYVDHLPLYRQEAIFVRFRPIAIGDKNWIFCGSEPAGQRAAAIMSPLATAKANGLAPYAWLTDVLTRLPTARDKHLDSLLPTSWYCPIG